MKLRNPSIGPTDGFETTISNYNRWQRPSGLRSQTTFRRTVSSISSVRFLVQGKMHRGTPIAVSLLGLLVIAPAFASPQESDTRGAIGAAASCSLPPNAVIDEIKFVGLHHIAPEAAKSPLSFHSAEEFNSAPIAAALRALNRLAWSDGALANL